MRYFFVQAKAKSDSTLVILIGLIFSFSMSPSRTISLGLTSGDDSPVLPAIVFNDPAIYTKSPNSLPFDSLTQMWSSSTKWVPAIFYKYLGLDPIIFHTLFTYMQITLILFGTYHLCKALSNSKHSAYISVFLVIIYESYFINSGAYGGETFMPYTTWISVGPLLLSWTNFLKEKRNKGLIWLVIGTSIHPSMGLCAAILILITLYNFSYIQKLFIKKIFLPIMTLCILISFFATTPLRLAQYMPSPKDWIELEVFHWAAWNLNQGQVYFQQTQYALVFSLSIFAALTFFRNKLSKLFTLTFKILITALFCNIIQAFLYSSHIRIFSSISFGRITIFSSIFLTIVVAIIFNEILFAKQLGKNKIILAMILYTFVFPSFLFMAILNISFLFLDLIRRSNFLNRIIYLTGTLLSSFFYLINLFSGINKDTNKIFIETGDVFLPRSLTTRLIYYYFDYGANIILLSFFIIIIFYMNFKNKLILNFMTYSLLILLVSITILGRFQLSRVQARENSEWINTQLWIKENTKPNEFFIQSGAQNLYGSFSTLTRRLVISADSGSGGSLYLYSKKAKSYETIRFNLGSIPNFKTDTAKYEMYIRKLSQSFEAKYLIAGADVPELNFTILYHSPAYIIYKIN